MEEGEKVKVPNKTTDCPERQESVHLPPENLRIVIACSGGLVGTRGGPRGRRE